MKYTMTTLFICSLLVAGCAQEARYVDQEFGMATRDAFDQQVVHKDGVYASKAPEGLNALHMEPVMQTYHQSFSEGFTKESINITDTGAN
ncbi:MAG: hypothetical protein C0614_06580 [Desulfuromonas sp.]|nr:MAG: hypothetical protein C0614_06580 [Desulfuromonas sp.]